MTSSVIQYPNGAWAWEIVDEDGETYLRSEDCFADAGMARCDLESASYLIRPYLKRC